MHTSGWPRLPPGPGKQTATRHSILVLQVAVSMFSAKPAPKPHPNCSMCVHTNSSTAPDVGTAMTRSDRHCPAAKWGSEVHNAQVRLWLCTCRSHMVRRRAGRTLCRCSSAGVPCLRWLAWDLGCRCLDSMHDTLVSAYLPLPNWGLACVQAACKAVLHGAGACGAMRVMVHRAQMYVHLPACACIGRDTHRLTASAVSQGEAAS